MKTSISLFLLILIWAWNHPAKTQILVQLTVNSGNATTTCTDPFDAPDPGWAVKVDGGNWVLYDGTGNCFFPSLPYLQYETSYATQGLVPQTVEVCFEAYEHDPNFLVTINCNTRSCRESMCTDLPIPTPGQSAVHTLSLPPGLSSGGSVTLTLSTSGSGAGPGDGICNENRAYGQVQADINRAYKVLPLPDSTFVIAGEWNKQAYLMKIDSLGDTLLFRTYTNEIGGNSKFLDLAADSAGGVVAVGECTHCMGADTVTKVVVLKTDANLQLDLSSGVKKFGTAQGGPFPSNTQRYSPKITAAPGGFMLVSTVGIGGTLNAEDLVMTRLSASLDSLWSTFHLLGFFERASDIVFTGDGYAIAINRPFSPSATALKTDTSGIAQWSRVVSSLSLQGMVYLPASQQLVLTGSRATPSQGGDVLLMRLDAASGAPLDSLLIGDPLNDTGFDLQVLDDGNLLLAAQFAQPNAAGSFLTSRIYRIQASPLQALGFDLIPNPDSITNMGVQSVLPLSCHGRQFLAVGIRGFYNRTFFHAIRACGSLISASDTSFCQGDSIVLTASGLGSSYLWSTGDTTPSITVTDGGTYSVSIQQGCFLETGIVVVTAIPLSQQAVNVSICSGEDYILPDGSAVSVPGVYPLTFSGAAGCDSIVTTTLAVDSLPLATITPDGETVFCAGDSLLLSGPVGMAAYLWSTGATSAAIFATDSGVYNLQVVSAAGCVSEWDNISLALITVAMPTITQLAGSDSLDAGVVAASYVWFLDGALLPVATQVIDAAAFGSGTYTVQALDQGCASALSVAFAYVNTGLDVAWAGSFRVYPNPSTGRFTLEGGQPGVRALRIRVFNSLGQEVLPAREVAPAAQWTEEIDLSGYAGGIYRLRIEDGQQVLQRTLLLSH